MWILCLFSLKNNEKIFMNVVFCSCHSRIKGQICYIISFQCEKCNYLAVIGWGGEGGTLRSVYNQQQVWPHSWLPIFWTLAPPSPTPPPQYSKPSYAYVYWNQMFLERKTNAYARFSNESLFFFERNNLKGFSVNKVVASGQIWLTAWVIALREGFLWF